MTSKDRRTCDLHGFESLLRLFRFVTLQVLLARSVMSMTRGGDDLNPAFGVSEENETFMTSTNDASDSAAFTQNGVERTNLFTEWVNRSLPPTNFSNETAIMVGDDGLQYSMWAAVLIVIGCTMIMVGTVVGNLLVCAAVSIVRKLRTPSNWLIVSLAVADLFVALLVMPLAAMYEVKGRWDLGQVVCDMWTSLDVMLCTASILNLCMISVDRYFMISQPFAYVIKRTPAMMAVMILSVWLLAAIITIPPIFGWKSKNGPHECELSQDIRYQIYATLGAFYLPLIVMIIIYYRIYTLSARIHRAEIRSKPSADQLAHRKMSVMSSTSKSSMENSYSYAGQNRLDVGVRRKSSEAYGSISSRQNSVDSTPLKHSHKRNLSFLHRSGFHRVSVSKERKATKTLGVIMGAFTACWLPFFIVALIKPFLSDPSIIPHWLYSLLQWLGFANSFFNPIIYARFNRDFRTPFKEILSCHCFGINSRLRSESYTEQFGHASDGNVGLPGGHRGTVIGRHPGICGESLPENTVADGLDKETRPKYLTSASICHSSNSFKKQKF